MIVLSRKKIEKYFSIKPYSYIILPDIVRAKIKKIAVGYRTGPVLIEIYTQYKARKIYRPVKDKSPCQYLHSTIQCKAVIETLFDGGITRWWNSFSSITLLPWLFLPGFLLG